MENDIELIPFKQSLAVHFTALNKAWLEKYFEVETIDETMLADPRKYIIDQGGFIFFALLNKEVAGTFALIKLSDTIFELSKMAVSERFQGLQVGNRMLHFCLQEAARMQLDKVILYSNTKLGPAIHLYRKFGFTEVPDFTSAYKRANIKMEITIKKL